MTTPIPPTNEKARWNNNLARHLDEQRDRLHDLISRQREHFDNLELWLNHPEQQFSEQLANQLEDSQQQVNRLTVQLEELTQQFEQNHQLCHSETARADQATVEIAALKKQLDELTGQLDGTSHSFDPSEKADDHDLHMQLELAVGDLRTIQTDKLKLEKELEAIKQASHPVTDPTGDWNWETQKQHLIAQLEGFDDNCPQQADDKLTVAGAISITDQIVTEKEKEIAELRKQLETQSGHSEAVVADDHTIAELLDHDQVILTEREKLRTIQEEWRDKLRQAEIDLSVERATIARERIRLDEQMEAFQKQQAENQQPDSPLNRQTNDAQPSGRRWLAKLGLTGADEQSG